MFQLAVSTRSWSRSFVSSFVVASALLTTPVLAGPDAPAHAERTRQLQHALDDVKARLGIPHPVAVVIVPSNPYLVSVETPSTPGGPFVIRVEERIWALLGDEELRAALAHELGHVWVFTHHPYLQTEQLANEIAMRVVSREVLVRVYDKVWKVGGAKGNVTAFLGPDPAASPRPQP